MAIILVHGGLQRKILMADLVYGLTLVGGLFWWGGKVIGQDWLYRDAAVILAMALSVVILGRLV